MKVREATLNDKKTILDFCKNTFSWGDYISDVWDFWIKEKHLFVIEDAVPIGVCHAFFSKDQVWIEGIRVHPSFRRSCLASKLISHVEHTATRKNILFSYMLIDTENQPSLSLAEKSNYKVFETWNFYSLNPQSKKTSEIKFNYPLAKIPLSHYVRSWRWIPLNELSDQLQKNYIIIFSDVDEPFSVAILTESEHFEKTLIVTLHVGSKINTDNIILYLQNYGFENNLKRIQILTKEYLQETDDLEHKLSFNLMKKSLD